ncbi:iron binding protein IscA for iron-sulfur cluster assembly [Klebsiella pneumoniae]|nr:iron binding protein IscA for iron-sulfur cluster assembly [Klebsiella pneumoniae]
MYWSLLTSRRLKTPCFEDKGVKVVIDGKSLQFLDGTQLDFVKEGLNEGFKFTNPNVKDECGCGESFNV